MRKCFAVAFGLLAVTGLLAQSQELPSAPSSTIQQIQGQTRPAEQQPAPPPQPSSQPTLESLEPERPRHKPEVQAPKPAATPAPPETASVSRPTEEIEPDSGPLTTIVKRVDEVNVIFTVTDKRGRFVKNLTKEDFAVRDNNQPPRSVVSFRSETDLPLRVGLLVDASTSIRDRFRFEQESAIEFLNQIIRPKSDRAFVLGFDTTPEITQDFTDSTEALSKGVRMLRPGGGTALYDAVFYSCRDKLMKAEQQGPLRRAIILLSDGEDNQSRATREEAIEMAQRAEVIIYAISTNVSGVKNRGDKVLERMAEATGGRAFFPFKIQDVADAFSEIQDELRSQYALSYRPADFQADGSYHSIEIVAQNHKKLKVRARKGYYAPKQ